ncbi:hypothetical protein P3T43_001800 [Paraburkholderia sp. GAS41]
MAERAGMGPNASVSLSACRARLNMSNGIAGIERADRDGRRSHRGGDGCRAPNKPKAASNRPQSSPKTDKNRRETSNPG